MKYFLSNFWTEEKKEISRESAVILFGEQVVNIAEDSGCISQGITFLECIRM